MANGEHKDRFLSRFVGVLVTIAAIAVIVAAVVVINR